MLAEIASVLRDQGEEVTPSELADALWLCQFGVAASSVQKSVQLPRKNSPSPTALIPEPDGTGERSDPPPADTTPTPPRPVVTPHPLPPRAVGIRAPASPVGTDKTPGFGFRISLPPALPRMLEIERALRPLARRVRTGEPTELDEEASVEASAETRAPVAVLCPKLERRFRGTLVVERSPSMRLWQDTAAAFKSLLWRTGGFRTLDSYHLSEGDGPQPHHSAAPTTGTRFPIDPGPDSLLIFFSDALSDRWLDGRVPTLLNDWAQGQPVIVVTPLPDRMWWRTALGWAEYGLISHIRGGEGAQRSSGGANRFKPVCSLHPANLARVAGCLVDARADTVDTFRLGVTEAVESPDFGGMGTSSAYRDIEDTYHNFFTYAAESTVRLAGYFASAPLFLPVMRLVQHFLVKDSEPADLAELFQSGLLRRFTPAVPGEIDDPDRIEYEFVDGVRERLLELAGLKSMLEVQTLLGKHIGRHSGTGRDFLTVLDDPGGTGHYARAERGESREPFARIEHFLLRQLGGEYALAAHRIFGSDEDRRDGRRLVLDHLITLHSQVRTWTESSLAFSKRGQPTSDVSCTLAYLDLLFAFGRARLGDYREAVQPLLFSASSVLVMPQPREPQSGENIVPFANSQTARFLYRAFLYRVEQALDGHENYCLLSQDLLDEFEKLHEAVVADKRNRTNPHGMVCYCISTMRSFSRILDPLQRLDPYESSMIHGNSLTRICHSLSGHKDIESLADTVQKLCRDGVQGYSLIDVRIEVLHVAIRLIPRYKAPLKIELLQLVSDVLTEVFPNLDLRSGLYPLSKVPGLIEQSLILAFNDGQVGFANKVFDQCIDSLQAIPRNARYSLVKVLARQSLQHLTRIRNRDSIDRLVRFMQLEVLEGKSFEELKSDYSSMPDVWTDVLQTFLLLAASWTPGLPILASPILKQAITNVCANTRIYGERRVVDLIRTYITVLSQMPLESGVRLMINLFDSIPSDAVGNSFTTSPYFSRLHLEIAEESVLSVCRMGLSQ